MCGRFERVKIGGNILASEIAEIRQKTGGLFFLLANSWSSLRQLATMDCLADNGLH
jgi:hypothetical protein